jgi:hypothetical protein
MCRIIETYSEVFTYILPQGKICITAGKIHFLIYGGINNELAEATQKLDLQV